MPTVNGRLKCCTCGADLGSADDPYRDPNCSACLESELEGEREREESSLPFTLQLYTVSGKFGFAAKHYLASPDDALAIVEKYATENGFTNVRCVDDENSIRFTATTPGGRTGRNLGSVDL